MDPAHRFSTPEIEEVFARAAAAQQADHQTDLGLSVEELQAVGAEAGLDPAHVAAAARAVAAGQPDDRRETLVGVPVGVRRSAHLDAPPSDLLWETLVSDLQETFSARGKVERIGASRIWRNGNLRATLSPSGDGSRLRIQSNRRKDSQSLLTIAAVNAVLAAVFTLNVFGPEADAAVFLALTSVFALVFVIGRQLVWSSARERQMEAVAARAQRTARATAAEPLATRAPVLDLMDFEEADDREPTRSRRRTR
ncbi:hypothetical protein [Rubrivirga sp. IMCC43871]|uniref:hypothetical protein n=1 Tax=Rubrivirga sp. IMCC43871 TaxID=3391575 RepID=UPI00398FE12B